MSTGSGDRVKADQSDWHGSERSGCSTGRPARAVNRSTAEPLSRLRLPPCSELHPQLADDLALDDVAEHVLLHVLVGQVDRP